MRSRGGYRRGVKCQHENPLTRIDGNVAMLTALQHAAMLEDKAMLTAIQYVAMLEGEEVWNKGK